MYEAVAAEGKTQFEVLRQAAAYRKRAEEGVEASEGDLALASHNAVTSRCPCRARLRWLVVSHAR